MGYSEFYILMASETLFCIMPFGRHQVIASKSHFPICEAKMMTITITKTPIRHIFCTRHCAWIQFNSYDGLMQSELWLPPSWTNKLGHRPTIHCIVQI